MSDLKAFLVDCEQENGAQIYFAKTAGQAKALAANEDGCDFTAVTSCRRKPEWDQYAPGPIPPAVALADGWWIECSGCSRRVMEDIDYDDEDDAPEPGGLVIEGQSVWCSQGCRARQQKRDADEKVRREALKARATAATLAAFPGVVVQNVNELYHRDEPYVRFDLPSGTRCGIGWEVGSEFVEVAPIDQAAWFAWEAANKDYLTTWENDGGATPTGAQIYE